VADRRVLEFGEKATEFGLFLWLSVRIGCLDLVDVDILLSGKGLLRFLAIILVTIE